MNPYDLAPYIADRERERRRRVLWSVLLSALAVGIALGMIWS
jgi:hypothetical protein